MERNQFNPYDNNHPNQKPEEATRGNNVPTANMYPRFSDPPSASRAYTAISNNQGPANAPTKPPFGNQGRSGRVDTPIFNTDNAAGYNMNAPQISAGPSSMPEPFKNPVGYSAMAPQINCGTSIMPGNSDYSMTTPISYASLTTSGVQSGPFGNSMNNSHFPSSHPAPSGAPSGGSFGGYMNTPSSNINPFASSLPSGGFNDHMNMSVSNSGPATSSMPDGGFVVAANTTFPNSTSANMPNSGFEFDFHAPFSNSDTSTMPKSDIGFNTNSLWPNLAPSKLPGNDIDFIIPTASGTTSTMPKRNVGFGMGMPNANSGPPNLPASSFNVNSNSTSTRTTPSVLRATTDGMSYITVKNVGASLPFYETLGFVVGLKNQGQITLTLDKFECYMVPNPTKSQSRHKIVVPNFDQVNQIVKNAVAAGGKEYFELSSHDPETSILTRGVRDPGGFHEWIIQNKNKSGRAIAETERRFMRITGGHSVAEVKQMLQEIQSTQRHQGMTEGQLQQPRHMQSIVKSVTTKANEAAVHRLVKERNLEPSVRRATMPGPVAEKQSTAWPWIPRQEAHESAVRQLMEQAHSEGISLETLSREASENAVGQLPGESYSEGSARITTTSDTRSQESAEDAAWREAIENFEEEGDVDSDAWTVQQGKGKGPAGG